MRVHLINSPVLNAFVAGGQRIFVNSGLIIRTETPEQLIGVLAHETGHIAGGHLSKFEDALSNASTQAIIASVIGGVLGALAKSGDAIAGGIAAGNQIGERSLLQFTRTQESAADQAAVSFMEQSGQSSRGLAEFLKVLGDQEALLVGRVDPYVRSHPVSSDRIAALSERISRSKFRDAKLPADFYTRHERIKAKLLGYLNPTEAMRRYPGNDNSVPARYARAFAYLRGVQTDRALTEVNALISDAPNDPYFHELKSQIYFDIGRISESLDPMRLAVKNAPNQPLLLFSLGQVMLAIDDSGLTIEAIKALETSVKLDPDYIPAWQQLAIGYGRSGDIGMATLASAERFLLEGNARDARFQAERASKILKSGTPPWLRAQDILSGTPERRR